MARYQESNSENRILSAAEYEFIHKGFRGARTMEIAKRAGVTHAMLHYYFHTKEELYKKIVENKLTLLKESVVNIFIDNDLPIFEALEAGVKQHLRFMRNSPDLPLFILGEIKRDDHFMDGVWPIIFQELQNNMAKVQKRLDEAADRGEMCRMSALTLFMDIFSLNMSSVVLSVAAQNFAQNADEDYWSQREQEVVTIIKKRLSI